MTNEKPITIDADTARRMALNAERTPRETIYGEATQTLNPITGRPYEDDGHSRVNCGYDGHFVPECELRRIKNIFHQFEERGEKYFSIIHSNLDRPLKRQQAQRTNQTIE